MVKGEDSEGLRPGIPIIYKIRSQGSFNLVLKFGLFGRIRGAAPQVTRNTQLEAVGIS